jgi:hypothetical protein
MGIATCYGPESLGFEPWWGQKFSLLIPIQTSLGAYPASSMMVIGTFLGEEQSWHGFDHPSPSSVENENG